jgi:hypothetical protein
MECYDTGKLSESETRNGPVTPVWGGALLLWIRFHKANMMTVADARRLVASRLTRWSGIAAPLWHIWLPAARLRHLAIPYEHACKSSPALHLIHARWIPGRVLGKSYFSWFSRPRQHLYTTVFFLKTGYFKTVIYYWKRLLWPSLQYTIFWAGRVESIFYRA